MSVLEKVIGARRAPAAATPIVESAGDDNAAAVQRLAAENETLRRKLAETTSEKAKLEREHQTVMQKYEATVVERDGERTRTALLRAASAANAVDPDEIADLLSRRVKLADGKVISADDPTVDANALVTKYLSDKPHHVRTNRASGSGAPAFPSQPPSKDVPAKHDTSTKEGRNAAFREQLIGSIKPTAGGPVPGR